MRRFAAGAKIFYVISAALLVKSYGNFFVCRCQFDFNIFFRRENGIVRKPGRNIERRKLLQPRISLACVYLRSGGNSVCSPFDFIIFANLPLYSPCSVSARNGNRSYIAFCYRINVLLRRSSADLSKAERKFDEARNISLLPPKTM